MYVLTGKLAIVDAETAVVPRTSENSQEVGIEQSTHRSKKAVPKRRVYSRDLVNDNTVLLK